MIARSRHPGPVARARAVIRPKIPPRAHAVFREIRVTEIAVEEVKGRPQLLDAERRIGRRRRAEVIVDVRRVRQRDARRRHVALAERRRALIAETREDERRPPARPGAERPELRLRTVVQRGIEIGGPRLQTAEPRVIGVHRARGRSIGIADLRRFARALELAVEPSEYDARVPHGPQRVPRHHHLGRGIRAELQVQPVHGRRREQIGRAAHVERGLGVRATGERRDRRKTGRGEQLAPTKWKAALGLRSAHAVPYAVAAPVTPLRALNTGDAVIEPSAVDANRVTALRDGAP